MVAIEMYIDVSLGCVWTHCSRFCKVKVTMTFWGVIGWRILFVQLSAGC